MTQPTGGVVAVAWRVTSQVEGSGRSANGVFVPGVTVGFALSTGESGSVFVPHADYNADSVARIIGERVKLIRTVGGLSGSI